MSTGKKHSFWYRNSLSLFFLFIFLITLGGQALTGWKEHNADLKDHNAAEITLQTYLSTGHFISATFENFESEFLQMAMYVLITVRLRQLGSSESKSLDEPEEVDRDPVPSPDAPWAVRKGGWILKVYSNSLSLVFLLLFLISWCLHLFGSFKDYNVEQVISGKPEVTIGAFLLEPRFWFETFQNWQSEFLSVLSIVFLTIYLRQKGSPESKPVDAPHLETGR
jgi:O-antigen ligase